MAETIDYKAVLEDLKAKKASLEQAIAAVEAIVGGGLGDATVLNGGSTSKAIEADTFIGLQDVQADERDRKSTRLNSSHR